MILNLIILLTISIVASASNIAAYWGQNAGGDQQTLGDYCSSSPASIIILSFLDGFPNLLLTLLINVLGHSAAVLLTALK